MSEELSQAALEAFEPPEFPTPEHEAAWQKLCASMPPCRTRNALALVLAGWTYREAARDSGLGSQSTVHDAAKRHGVLHLATRTDRLVQSHREVVSLALDRLIEEGSTGFQGIASKDVAIIAGISADKIQKHEQQHSTSTGGLSALERIGRQIVDSGGRVSLTMTVERGRDEQTIEAEVVSDG